MRRAYITTAVFTALFLNISVAIAQFIPVDQIPQQVQNQITADVINDVGQLDMDELHFRFREWLLTQPRMDADGILIDSGNCNQCVPPNDDQDLSFPSVRGLKVISRKNGSVARNFKVKWRRPPRLSRPLRDRYELDRYEVYLTKDDGTYELHTIIKTTNARGNERLPRRIRFRNRELGLYTISVRPVYAPIPESDPNVPNGQLTDDKVRAQSKAYLAGQGYKKGGWTPPDLADVTPDSTVAVAFANGENPELEACILDRQHFGYTQVPGGPLVQGWIDYDEDTQLLDVEWLDCSDPDTDSSTVNQESITSVEELENFIGLRGLNLDGNSVQSITALSELSELIELNLNGNMGVNLDRLVDLQELEELELADLNLTQIPVLGVQSLTNLNLSTLLSHKQLKKEA